MEDVIILSVLGVIFLLIGGGIGYLIGKKTNWLEKLSKVSLERNKILKNPKLLKKKIEESAKKLNPHAEGNLEMFDGQEKINMNIETKDGKEVLNITKSIPIEVIEAIASKKAVEEASIKAKEEMEKSQANSEVGEEVKEPQVNPKEEDKQ